MSGKYSLVKILGLFGIFVVAVEPANILCVFTSYSPSHQIIHMSYVKGLVENGHNVTVVTTSDLKDVHQGYHHILIPLKDAKAQEIAEEKKSMEECKSIWQYLKFASTTLKLFATVHYDAVKSDQFQELMNNPGNKFDLIILGYFLNDYHLGLGEHFNCPIIISWTIKSNEFLDRYLGNPPEISYVPSILAMSFPDPKTFLGRLEYFYGGVLSRIWVFIMDRHSSELYNDLFPPSKYPPIEIAAKRVSLLLLNTHFSEGFVRPNVPAVIDIGGVHIKEKPDPLPKELQEIISSSKDGVIYLSFGSNLGVKEIGPEVVRNFYNVLSSLKQTVIWKCDDSDRPLGNSSNIHFMEWLPQDDLLAQDNVKLFITHAGKGSVAESQYHGVPMLAMPIFGDQPANAAKLTSEGFGIQLDSKHITDESIRVAVLEVLQNPKYTENIQRFSRLYRDRPMSPKQTAMFWIEYVLRHKGAYHMQSPAVHMNVFQYLSLDVIAFLVLVAYLILKSIKWLIKFAYRTVYRLFNSNQDKLKHQ